KSTIELEFRYNLGPSTMFFHNMHTCPRNLKREDCNECERMRKMYDRFAAKLNDLRFGDTFKIKAALINNDNDQSVLPAEVHNFESYQPLWVACTVSSLRLDDTPEGINKKQRAAEKIPKWRRTKESIQQFLGDRPYITQIIISIIGGLIAGVILTTFVEPIPRWIISFF
ncbi:MAG: hypothetical protein MJE68_09925, partial [Proteobacteria bacterium]|nr:hypothetical protein [Pseudomonadota bacterium]